MSDTFEKILVKDDRLGCITPKVKFQVFKGGQNITCQPYKAISETTANHVYNVTVPSLETIIRREVLWRSTVALHIANPGNMPTEFAMNYGITDALAPFSAAEYRRIDMHSCMNLNRVDIVVYWKDTFGNIHPFELHPGCSANVKLMFRRKYFNTNN